MVAGLQKFTHLLWYLFDEWTNSSAGLVARNNKNAIARLCMLIMGALRQNCNKQGNMYKIT